MTPQEIYNLFFYRSCPFAVKTSAGFYIPVWREVTLTDIQKHLDGKHTIGAYNARMDGTCKWMCLDFDSFEYELTAKKIVKDLGIKYLFRIELEISPSKGYHVWIFLNNPISIKEAYVILINILKENYLNKGLNSKIDIFPCSPILTGKKISWLVKIPLRGFEKI